MMKDRTYKYAGGLQQHNMFYHLSYKNKSLCNTFYPYDMVAQEHLTTNTSTSSDNSTRIKKIIQQENLLTLDIINAIHLSSKRVGITYLFLSTVDKGETIAGFHMYDISKEYTLEHNINYK